MAFINGVDPSTGRINQAAVSEDGRLEVAAVTESIVIEAVEDGDAFTANTNLITLTSAADTPVFYLKNGVEDDILITSVNISTLGSTGGADNLIVVKRQVLFDPSSTLITAGTVVPAVNRNGGSAKQFDGTLTKGATGLTLVTPTTISSIVGDFTTQQTLDFSSIIPKNGEVAVSVTPPAGNTSMGFIISVSFQYVRDL